MQKLRNRVAAGVSTLGLLVGATTGLAGSTFADSSVVNFEAPAYSVGSVDGQNGWSALGSAGHGCAKYDEGVVANTYGYTGFGGQSFRVSNAVTSGCFGDQAFAPALSQQAGEPGALDKNGNPVAAPLSQFQAQFDIASTTKAVQPGMALSVSPDDGVGARMSYLRFVDQADGMHVYFDDVTDPGDVVNADSFNESDVATLGYGSPHNVKFLMNFVSGPDNDVVNIYIDGALVHSGTSWEDYYRFDTESNPTLNNVSRTVSTLLFREGGSAVPANAGNGYLIDNLAMGTESTPATKTDCSGSSWKSAVDSDGNAFKNQGQCVSWVEHNMLGNGQSH